MNYEYQAIRSGFAKTFADDVNLAAKDGYRVIGSGFNDGYWWAVLERELR